MKLKIKKLNPEAKLPEYAHYGDAGMDIFSTEDLVIPAGKSKLVSTGIAMEIPKGYVGFVWDKSGISTKNNVHHMAGVIDSIYRGEIKICLINLGKEDFKIEKGMKVVQMIIQEVECLKIVEKEKLKESERGEKGFGSTGI